MKDSDASTPSLEDNARALAEALGRQDFATVTRDFDATMRGALSPEALAGVWQSIVAKLGARRSIAETRRDRQGGFDVVFVTCEHERGRLDVKVVYDAQRKVAGLFVVPAWEPPGYATLRELRERPVTVGAAPWELPGTLTLPAGAGPFPALVLVHGSGPQDRDETIGPNRPFRDLALGLASRGVAVLRYEKRSHAHGARMAKDPTLTANAESVDDALTAAELLRNHEAVDPRRVFVLGHSLGGQLLPRVGARDAKLAGLVVLAGSTRKMQEVIVEQLQYIAATDGNVDTSEKRNIEAVRAEAKKLDALEKSGKAESDAPILGAPPAYWLDLAHYDAPTEAKKLSLPMLVLQGERDYQVTMKDFSRWKKALGGRKNVRFVSYPELNHLFIAGVGPSKPSEYDAPGHVDRRVIEDIAKFVLETKP